LTPRAKLALAASGIALLLLLAYTAYEAAKTLRQLEVVEAERDHWQRPDKVLAALNLKPGNTVIDFGCGSGYFTLKLSSVVGSGGTVYAVDIRRLPLTFLWARSVRKNQHNIYRVLSTPNDPPLPSGAAQAVLISNTYHELADPNVILDRVYRSLVPGGRLVVLDPMRTEHGTLASNKVEEQLREHGFDIVNNDSRFIDESGPGLWWMIVAQK
jgi:ubiquinone/menaquinone biosynthesis C-methylase UbiE